jgi:hypothetical protein
MSKNEKLGELEVGDIVEVAFDYGSVYGGKAVWQGTITQIRGDEIVLYNADVDLLIDCRRAHILRWLGREG